MKTVISVAALTLAVAGCAATAQELRIGTSPILGSGTFFGGLYDSGGNLTNVPAASTGLNPAAPFTGTIRLGGTFGAFSPGLRANPGAALVNINNQGPTYPFPFPGGTTVPGEWFGQINLVNGQVAAGSFIRIQLSGAFAGDFYQANVNPASGVFVAAGPSTWNLQAQTITGAFSGPTFGGVNVSQWFNQQGVGNNLFGSLINIGSNSGGGSSTAPAGLFSMELTTTAVIPLPAAAWAGMGTLSALGGLAALRRRKLAAQTA